MGKRLSIFLLVIVVVYVIYYDLTKGTLYSTTPLPTNESITKTSKENIPYKNIEIKSGDTLLSIVEQLSTTSPMPSSDQIISDFQILNPKVSPTELTIGKSYKIPIYN